MATDPSFVEYVAEQSGLGDRLTTRKMFGEYALYLGGKVVGFACDNSVFIKPLQATEHLTQPLPKRPPYPGAKLYPVADEWLDDTERFQQLLLATEAAAPLPKPKTGKKKVA
ncbi:MAG: TfoX/Sxy family protein [Brachymonas sp.]|nr:TfoX/Sxy family protein [Brachymonas sp.]